MRLLTVLFMSEALHCDLCGKAATVHLTQIINNKIQKVDLCEECAQKKGVSDPDGFSLADLLAKNFAVPGDVAHPVGSATLSCGTCGCSAKDFKKTGRLGCADCYEALGPIIMPILAGVHRGTEHVGKVPERLKLRIERRRRFAQLDEELQHAIRDERYEDAAGYRDQIEQLKAELESISADH